MSDIGEALGTVAEGGLYSRAVEKTDGEGPVGAGRLVKGHFAEETCLNCETSLHGTHCHNCGQKAHLHRTIHAFMHDLLHGALHFEGKMWSTLPKLVLKPGELTRRYVAGERAKFVSPMALFLFSVFLMFAIFQAVGLTAPTLPDTPSRDQIKTAIAAEIKGQEDRIETLDERLADENLEQSVRERLNRRRQEAVGDLETARAAAATPFVQGASDGTQAEADGTATPDGESDTRVIASDSSGDRRMTMNLTGIDWIDNGIVKKWEQNPSLMLYKLQANSYKFSWLLIPLSVPFVWLLFAWKRNFRAYDHAIFVTYSLSFMSLLFISLSIMGILKAHTAVIAFAALFIPPIHMYKQLRGAYGLSRFSALWRLVVLQVFILIVLVLFLQLLLVIGAF
ncbi:hypothetical protein GCM10010923_19310 [Blastomonas marina]|uniref:DUF3667 domain-containing protein n=1 Tax=Blastomonas marina TaxID=1867408 RepID=A0ABQ1FFJ3_9SPHN|nr:DUF3667 domain-containing protein [Blastomonas marina]GGA09125.1 hypothetical protein GCM10010923_19310 [Blastomonas marina]